MVKKKGTTQVVFAHLTIGIQLAITIFIFVLGGHKLDLYYDKSPLFLIVGTALGMSIGFYHLLKDLQGDEKESEEDEKTGGKNDRVKWN